MFATSRSAPSQLMYHLWTLFLFTKSDFKTTLLPISSFATAAAPLANNYRLPHILLWIWLHLLQFNVSNQSLRPEEDEHNKSWRPIPAKRISHEDALTLRWVLLPLCVALSACYSIETVYASIALSVFTYVYDDLGFSGGHWFGRNAVNALGVGSFEVGACLVAGSNRHALDKVAIMSILCSAGIVITTFQAQDFKDTEGDRLIGRKTLPIVAPSIARPMLLFALSAWSIVLSVLCQLGIVASAVFNILALAVGMSFVTFHTIKADQRSYYLYNVSHCSSCSLNVLMPWNCLFVQVWLSVANVLPACLRLIAAAPVA
ncbi:UbiA prenyltransferase family-domain-containing protein [Phellopilus nigrolimitatus]|nr:UbiA prenyltransferase family-domain-containing protein [Phellopilus nigrolimitatus]